MARYYDDETLIEFIKQNTPNIDGETTIKSIVRAIHHAPTADVVPKSEYDERQELLAAAIAGQKTLQEHLANVRADVAREIFDEIEKLKHTKFDWNDYVDWDAIAELKKKYTEVSK